MFVVLLLQTIFCFQVFATEKEESKLGGLVLTKPSSDDESFAKFYGLVEVRHQQNTYFDQQNYRTGQIPTWQGRLRLGANIRSGLIDIYGTLGVIKETQTQQLLQKRPEIEVDIYPWASNYGQIVQYTLVKLPFSENENAKQKSEENTTQAKQGSIYVIGISPVAMLPMASGIGEFKLKAGLDYWTELYSRRQEKKDLPDEDRQRHYGVAQTEEEEETEEDSALRLFTEYMVGTAYAPSFLSGAVLDIGAFYDSYFIPKYDDLETSGEEEASQKDSYRYTAVRESHYRIRLQYDLSERMTLSNEFYHFHDGLFAGRKKGDDRRFRNIAQIAYRL